MNLLVVTKRSESLIKFFIHNNLNIILEDSFIIIANSYKTSLRLLKYFFIILDVIIIDKDIVSNDTNILKNIYRIIQNKNNDAMKTYTIILFVMIISFLPFGIIKSHAQHSFAANQLSVSNIVTVDSDTWNMQQNPASAATNKNLFIGTSFSNVYNIKNFNYLSTLLVVPIYNNNFGISASTYGIKEFRNFTFGFSYAKALTPRFNFGLLLNYSLLKIFNHPNLDAFSVNIGAQYLLTDTFTLGVFLENISKSRYNNKLSSSELYSAFNIGLAYLLNTKVSLLSEIRKSLDYPVDLAFAIRYSLTTWMALSGGVSTRPFNQYLGIKLNIKNMIINLSFFNSRSINGFPSLSLAYNFT